MVRFGRKPKRAIVCRTSSRSKKSRSNSTASSSTPKPAKLNTTPSRSSATVSSSPALASIQTRGTLRVGRRLARRCASFRPSVDDRGRRERDLDKIVATLAERFGINVRMPVMAGVSDAPVAEAKTTDTATAWGAAALRSACEMIADAGSGSQEATLNGQCYGVGQLVAGGELPEAEALSALRAAAAAMPGPRSKESVERGRDLLEGEAVIRGGQVEAASSAGSRACGVCVDARGGRGRRRPTNNSRPR